MAASLPLRPEDRFRRRVVSARVDLELRPLRYAGGAMLAAGFVLAHLPRHPGLLSCPLRRATGVPCPFCGLTTSVAAVVHGDVHAAWLSNPFGLVAIAFALALVLRPRWQRLQVPLLALVVGVALSWAFELHRFRFL